MSAEYVLMGAGTETTRTSRSTLPEGTAIVVVGPCKNVMDPLVRFAHLAGLEKGGEAVNATTTKEEIARIAKTKFPGSDPVVYTAGDRYPVFQYNTTGFMNVTGPKGVLHYPSGVYRLPIPKTTDYSAEWVQDKTRLRHTLSRITVPSDWAPLVKYLRGSKSIGERTPLDVPKSLYEGAVYPPPKWNLELTIQTHILAPNAFSDTKQLFDEVGPGVYYWVLCAAPPPPPPRIPPGVGKPNEFVFLGHGEEYVVSVEDRMIMPKDTVLVTVTECGRAAAMSSVRERVSELSKLGADYSPFPMGADRPAMAAFIKSERFKIFDPHIYKPGEKYPDLIFQPPLSFVNTTTGVVTIEKSGVYKLPIPPATDYSSEWKQTEPDIMTHTETGTRVYTGIYREGYYPRMVRAVLGPDKQITTDSIREITPIVASMYEGAVYPAHPPDAAAVDTALNGTAGTRVSDIMQELGPGVYYWIVCRGDGKVGRAVDEARAASALKQRTAGRRQKRRKTYRKKRAY